MDACSPFLRCVVTNGNKVLTCCIQNNKDIRCVMYIVPGNLYMSLVGIEFGFSQFIQELYWIDKQWVCDTMSTKLAHC